jgi:putative cardiolipin synthase
MLLFLHKVQSMRKYLNLGTLAVVLLVIVGCASAPLDYPKETSVAIADTSNTHEAQKTLEWLGGRTDVNGFYPLSAGFDAYGVRLGLMALAEASIDAQYFIMAPDAAGLVFANTLLEAADRGVRVRLLLDDAMSSVEDADLAMLNDHPNVELRMFNPVSRRGIYAFNYLGNFGQVNRRMHNKAFIVDNQIAVVGGRNLAAEYFQLELTRQFIDFDMVAAGPIVKEVSAEFDTYWNHVLAVPMEALYTEDDPEKIKQSRAQMKAKMAQAGDTIYAEAINTSLTQKIHSGEAPPYIAEAQLFFDSPDKLMVEVSSDQQVAINRLRGALAEAKSEIFMVTPYLIPRKQGIEFINQLRANGVRVVILTNSLASNNHTSVHSAYSKYRNDLLKAGVELWEARADAKKVTDPDGQVEQEHLTLHMKGALIDRERVFVGSINLDPRSIDINTELGMLIDSPELATLLTNDVIRLLPEIAYRLELDANEKITWHATIDGKEVVETKEPQTTAARRFNAQFLKILPESQL